MKFRDRMAGFMSGRNGTDAFARFQLVVALLLAVVSAVVGGTAASVMWALALAVLIYCYYRILSRDLARRERENLWYLRKKEAVTRWFQSLRDRWQQRKEYRFFRCPGCHALLRVPKGKGKILLTCRKCGRRFERKT